MGHVCLSLAQEELAPGVSPWNPLGFPVFVTALADEDDQNEPGETRCSKDKPCSNGDCCVGSTGRVSEQLARKDHKVSTID